MLIVTLLVASVAQPPGVAESRLPNHLEDRFDRLFYDLDRLGRAGVDVRELQQRAWQLRLDMSEWSEPKGDNSANGHGSRRLDCCPDAIRANGAPRAHRPAVVRARARPDYR